MTRLPVKIDNLAVRFFLDPRRKETFYALKDFSMEMKEGEILGLIGKNGAGKSTLLKIIAGILYPTEGSVNVYGKVAPLLELGSSFIPDLSGYDNIFFTGGLFGFSPAEIAEKVPKIVDFSGMERFINLPVKNYSTGMFARLSFSTMLFFDPDIVLIDEVFAVGDEDFQKKSMNRIFEFKNNNKTIVIATHNLSLIESFCDRAIVLDSGKNVFDGSPAESREYYLSMFQKKKKKDDCVPVKERWGSKEVEITRCVLLNKSGDPGRIFSKNDYLEILIEFDKKIEDEFVLGLAIKSKNGFLITGPNVRIKNRRTGRQSARMVFDRLILNEGEYIIDVSAYDTELVTPYDHISNACDFLIRKTTMANLGFIELPGKWLIND